MSGHPNVAPSKPATPAQRSPDDAANEALTAMHRANLVLKGLDIIIADQIGFTHEAMPTPTVEIIWELVSIAQSILEGAENAAVEAAFASSGAAADRRCQGAPDPRRPAPAGPVGG